MRIGINVAQSGRLADAAAIAATARAAEQVGYATLWVLDHVDRRTLDPLLVLAWAAAATNRIRLGTSVLVAPRYGVAELIRSVASLDVLAEGRLTLGLGPGDTGATGSTSGPGGPTAGDLPGDHLDRVLDALDDRWGCGTGDGAAGRPAPSSGGVVPRRQVRPPLLLSDVRPDGLDRVARRADGWNPLGLGPEAIGPMWARLRGLADRAGRDPDGLELVVRADVEVTDGEQGAGRRRFCGSIGQVAADLGAVRDVGAHEVILRACGDLGLDESLDVYARIAEAVSAG